MKKYLFLLFLGGCGFQSETTNSPEPTDSVEILSTIDEEPLQQAISRIYKKSYDEGYNSFLSQIGERVAPRYQYTNGQIIENDSDKEFEENKDYKEAMLKGYTDGYHKATEIYYCPRKDY